MSRPLALVLLSESIGHVVQYWEIGSRRGWLSPDRRLGRAPPAPTWSDRSGRPLTVDGGAGGHLTTLRLEQAYGAGVATSSRTGHKSINIQGLVSIADDTNSPPPSKCSRVPLTEHVVWIAPGPRLAGCPSNDASPSLPPSRDREHSFG